MSEQLISEDARIWELQLAALNKTTSDDERVRFIGYGELAAISKVLTVLGRKVKGVSA